MISHIVEEYNGSATTHTHNSTNRINPSVFYYIPNFLTNDEEKLMFDYLETTNDFQSNPKYTNGISRMQKWYHVEQKYFCPMWKERYPQWMSFPMDPTIHSIIGKVQAYIQTIPHVSIPNINSCLINKYPTGEHFIAPHRDSPLSFGEEPTIIGLTVGQTRKIDFKHNTDVNKNFSFDLESGSIFIMGGSSQKFYQHAINKCDCTNVRYSLTFREFIL